MNPEQIVRDFCDAVRRRDCKALAGFFTEDAVYHNIPIDPVVGRDQIEATLVQFVGPSTEAAFDVLALAVSGRKVLTERVDRFVINGKRIEIPVMGTFEVETDGRISAWRDYFDMAQFMKQMG